MYNSSALRNAMRKSLLLSILLTISVHNFMASGWVLQSTRLSTPPQGSNCPVVTVSCPDDVTDKETLIFKVQISEAKNAGRNLTYKWSVSGGEIKDGDGTPSITVVNFLDAMKKEALRVSVEVGGLPEGCGNEASCTTALRHTRPQRK